MRLLLLSLLLVPLTAPAAVILQYHHVSADTPPATSVTPEQFASHMDRLEQLDFRVLPLDELVTAVRDGLDPRKKVAAVTFDDGYANTWENALPVLEKHGWKGSWFVTTDKVSEGGITLSAGQLRKLHKGGHLVANHTRSHPHMVRRRDGESRKQWLARLRGEITEAGAQLEAWLGEAPPKLLAYPYGESTPAIHGLLEELDYIGFGQHTGALGPHTDWHDVPRIAINRRYADWDRLKNKILAQPLPVLAGQPADPVTTDRRPELVLTLAGDWRERNLQCFAAGRPARVEMALAEGDTRVGVRAREAMSTGRQRYNCTAPAGEGRFHWHSRQWMIKPESGWYAEP